MSFISFLLMLQLLELRVSDDLFSLYSTMFKGTEMQRFMVQIEMYSIYFNMKCYVLLVLYIECHYYTTSKPIFN